MEYILVYTEEYTMGGERMKINADVLRKERGTQIANTEGCIKNVKDKYWKVKSQSFDGFYIVEKTEIGWTCNCPDHKFRGMKCKHVWAVEISVGIREQARPKVVLEPIVISDCPVCNSRNIQKKGIRHNKCGEIQKYRCMDCGKWFSINVGFERMKHNPKAITAAMQLYFSGESLRNTQRSLEFIGTKVSHRTVANWIEKYVTIMKEYMDNIKPNVGQTWRADEVYVKIRGDMKYLFALMDDETRYWIAQEVADSKYKHDANYSTWAEKSQEKDLKPS